jgi:pentatricopeptide repeat protein
MIDSGIHMDIGIYNTVLNGLFGNNSSDEADTLFKKLRSTKVKINITTFNTMISGMFKARRIEEAKYLFDSISTNKVVPCIVTYSLMITNFINEGLLEEADAIFSAMENAVCAPNSRLLNHATRLLLQKGEIIRAANYLAKIDKNDFSLEASTFEMLMSLFSRNEAWQEHVKLFPAKYQFIVRGSFS